MQTQENYLSEARETPREVSGYQNTADPSDTHQDSQRESKTNLLEERMLLCLVGTRNPSSEKVGLIFCDQ